MTNLRIQLRRARLLFPPRTKRTKSYMESVMIPESEKRLKEVIDSILNPVPPCYQGIEGGHDFIETTNNTTTCIYCGEVINI